MNEKTVLLISGENDNANIIKENLLAEGFKVLLADTAKTAMSVLEQHEIPVVICSQQISDMACTTLLTQIKNLYPNTVKILISNTDDNELIRDALNKAEIFKFLYFPANEGDLTQIVNDCVEIYFDREAKEKKSQVLDSALELIAITNQEDNIEAINYPFQIFMGYPKDEIIHQNLWDLLFSIDDKQYYYDMIMQELILTKTWEGKVPLTLKNGKRGFYLLTVSEMPNKKTGTAYRSYSFIDLAELKQKDQFLSEAVNNQNTSLTNRATFQKGLQSLLADMKEGVKVYMIALYFDDDHFADIQLFDERRYLVFNTIGSTLKQKLTDTLLMGRIGANVIGVVLESSQIEIIEYLQKINDIFNYPFIIGLKPIYLGPYLGLSVYPNDTNDASVLINEAILAAEYGYINKNRRVIYAENLNQIKHNTQLYYFEITKTLQSQGFKVFYQPIMAAQTKKIKGFEAFINIPNMENAFVLEDHGFLSKVDDFDLMDEVHKQLISEAINQVRYWQERYGEKFTITINLAPGYLAYSDLPEYLFKIFRQVDVGSENVIFSISEKYGPANFRRMKIMMKDLIEMGIKFELNDFGCGYASLPNLTLLPFNALKLDLGYLKSTFSIAKGYKILHTLNMLCKSMGIVVTAKSIEDDNILTFSEDIECDLLQGNLLSTPLDSNRIRSLLDYKFEQK